MKGEIKINKQENIPSWIKLDNAATIYPSILTKKYAAMFRISATLYEKVDENILYKALKNVIKRFPTFRYKLKMGLFWHYFKHIDGIPDIQNDVKNPMLRINFKENNNFMFRVRYFDKRISVEYFHALTDGNGGLTFLLSLVCEYLKLKNDIKVEYNNQILNPNEKAKKEEYNDSFYKYARGIGSLFKEKKAYHYKGTMEEGHLLNIITGIISINEIKKKCTQYNCTITEFIVSLMILSLQEIQEKENIKQSNKKPIKISIPVDLRKIYKTNTMRNFSSYVNVFIETRYGHYSFEEIINQVKNQMNLMITEKNLNAKISGNVNLSKNYFIRLIPMFIKKHIISFIEKLMGDRYCSSTFSNLGLIELPSDMQKNIKELGVIIGRSRGKPGSCSCVGFKSNLYISFSRRIKEAEFERLFFTKLVQMNIGVEIESNVGR